MDHTQHIAPCNPASQSRAPGFVDMDGVRFYPAVMRFVLACIILATLPAGRALAQQPSAAPSADPAGSVQPAAEPSLPRSLDALLKQSSEASAADSEADAGAAEVPQRPQDPNVSPDVVPGNQADITLPTGKPFDDSNLPVLPNELPEPAPSGTVTAPPGPIPPGELPVLSNDLPEAAPSGSVTAPPGLIPKGGDLPVLPNALPEPAPDGPVEIPRSSLDDPLIVPTETIRREPAEGPPPGAATAADGSAPPAAPAAAPPAAPDASVASEAPTVAHESQSVASEIDPADQDTGNISARLAVDDAFRTLAEPAQPAVSTAAVDPSAIPAPAFATAVDEPTSRAMSAALRTFLPLPLASPPRLPQREGPGVVVSALPVVEGANPTAPELMLTLSSDRVRLSEYAFGAFQRGLYNTALSVALQAAADNEPAAAALIGRIYEEAHGVKQDFAKAAGWYAIAAELGDASGRARLARLLLTGRGIPRDVNKAADVFAEAADAGNAEAAYSLALMIIEGKGRARTLEEAFRYMKIGAEGGIAKAQYALGVMYDDGDGTLPDDAAATRWFGRAAAQGDVSAAVEYALRLYNGVGVPPDQDRAEAFFAEAARAGNVVAMNRLARILASSVAAPEDEAEAVKWHLLARQAGISDLFLDGFMGTRSERVVAEGERRAAAFKGG